MRNALYILLLLLSCTIQAQEQFAVYFNFDEQEATAPSGRKLSDWMSQHKDAEIVKVYGYADSIGTAEYNITLSQRRADFVLARLKGKYDLSEADVKGLGETNAFSDNRSTDRVVIIHYINPKQRVVSIVKGQPAVKGKQPQVPLATKLTTTISTAKIGDRVRLPDMNFYKNEDLMMPEAKPVVKELLEVMNAQPTLKIAIQGHICCNRLEGSRLSIRRAKVIYDYLLEGGIAESRISYEGFAGTRPIHYIPEKTEEEMEENRRVEVEIIDK